MMLLSLRLSHRVAVKQRMSLLIIQPNNAWTLKEQVMIIFAGAG